MLYFRHLRQAAGNWLRRCWSCLGPLGPRERKCLRCGAAQPRDP
jgi:hypothetical protein